MLLITGAALVPLTAKGTPLLIWPSAVTTTFPDVAPDGTGTTMAVGLHVLGIAATPLKVIVLLPCVAPKLLPVTVITFPIAPDVGVTAVMTGWVITVNDSPLLGCPPTVTTTKPEAAPAGTGATILLALQLVGTAKLPLNVTVLLPCVAPKLKPLIVIDVPGVADVIDRLLI